MDKYTYNLKADKIQTLVRRGDYETAARIADTMEWTQEKNVRLLNAAAEAYEKVGKNTDATELLLRAYERSSAGKRILYKLTELALASGNVKDAETFFKKYLEEAKDDNDRYVLRYQIAEARNESVERKIKILEAYHKLDPDEETYTCKLAELYKEAGRSADCVALCDQIILWFGVGPCVDKAMELKECFEPLTKEQEEHRANKAYYEAQVQRIADEMAKSNAAETEKVLDPQDSSEAIANYSASVDSSLIQELMEEEIRETAEQAAAEEALEKSLVRQTEEQSVPADEEEVVVMAVEEEEEVVPVEEAAEETAAEEASAEAAETAAEEVPAEATETAAEEVPAEAAENDVPAGEADEEPSAETRNLEDVPGWKDTFRQPMEENTDPTREIVIPAEFRRIAEGLPEESAEEPETAAEPEAVAKNEVPVITADITSAIENTVPVISMDESEQADLENRSELPETEIPRIFEHEHCIFLPNVSAEEDTDRAVDALFDYYNTKNMEMAQVARIPAAKLNKKGLIGSLPKLIHKDLIIDQANDMTDELLTELLRIVDYMDTDKLFVLMDQDGNLQDLKIRMLNLAPEMSTPVEEKLPKIRMTESEAEPDPEPAPEAAEPETPAQEAAPEAAEPAPAEEAAPEAAEPAPAQEAEPEAAERKPERVVSFENINEDVTLGERDFIRYAEYFAHELECSLDDSAYDALEDEMADILQEVGVLTAGDVEDLIEDAADQAEKKKFGKKYDKEGFLILRKKNFK